MRVLTSSSQLPLKLPGHGTRWLLNWFKRLADGSHLSPRTTERQYFCSSACPLPFNGEMRSPSSARSLPPINHPLQSLHNNNNNNNNNNPRISAALTTDSARPPTPAAINRYLLRAPRQRQEVDIDRSTVSLQCFYAVGWAAGRASGL